MERPRQPLLHDQTIVLAAPVQAWSGDDGNIGTYPVHGIYLADVRILRSLTVELDGQSLEHLATVPISSSHLTFVSTARQLDDPHPDPGVRVEHSRIANRAGIDERIVVRSRLNREIRAQIVVRFGADAARMDTVKEGVAAGAGPAVTVLEGVASWSADHVDVRLNAPGAILDDSSMTWQIVVPATGTAEVAWSIAASDAIAVVESPQESAPWAAVSTSSGDDRLARWVSRALADLDALRLVTIARPDQQFLAAGAPWFLTLFGRDALWSARFMLPLGTRLAGDTLRVLAGLQGDAEDDSSAEEPGKIVHELRREAMSLPTQDLYLPPLYYGTVDATALWVCLLYDAWSWGLPESEVRELVPHLERALTWMRDYGDSDGDGLLEYIDRTGRGLSNQGWKDSGDSVQWRDGTLAVGPIALVEVQAYAYEAAIHGAELLDAFGGDGSPWRDWAATLRTAFHASYWLADAEGPYLAIALDAEKRAVDTVTSNMGHVLGTGILDSAQAASVARRLVLPELDSGYGLRTMATSSTGYWPLSYHGGSVWTHDTAIAIAGLVREGCRTEADVLTSGLLAAASGFGYRMPELHSGDTAAEFARPIPYPAACRPQSWSAAAAISVLASTVGLQPSADRTGLGIRPSTVAGSLGVTGIAFGGSTGSIHVDAAGDVTASDLPLVVG